MLQRCGPTQPSDPPALFCCCCCCYCACPAWPSSKCDHGSAAVPNVFSVHIAHCACCLSACARFLCVRYILNCGSDTAGSCDGGSAEGAFQFAQKGIPEGTCLQYEAVDNACSAIDTCRNCVGPPGSGTCFAQKNYTSYFVDEFSDIQSVAMSHGCSGPSVDAVLLS